MVNRLAHIYSILLILILIAALNASRLFYLPLSKLHASSSDVKTKLSPLIVQQSVQDVDAGKTDSSIGYGKSVERRRIQAEK